MNALDLLGAVAVAIGLTVVAVGVVRTWMWVRAPRLVTCPETDRPAAVMLDSRYVTTSALVGRPALRLADCSRWPERGRCGEPCLMQIEESPQDCLVRTTLARWYAGKSCVFCHRPFGLIHWHDHKPAVRRPDGTTVDWSQIPPALVPETLASGQPACWNCHIAESFRHDHPDLVVERPRYTHPPA